MSNRTDRVNIVRDWVNRTFGESVACNIQERVARILEEATELAAAEGLSHKQAGLIVDEVFGRPKAGVPWQEAGGVAITFLAYCGARAYDPDDVELTELRRILAKPGTYFRNRQTEKAAAGTALPPAVAGASGHITT